MPAAALFKGPDIIDDAPDVVFIGHFFLKARHIAFPLLYFIQDSAVGLAFKPGKRKVPAGRIKPCGFGSVAPAGFAVAGGTMQAIQRLSGAQRFGIGLYGIGPVVVLCRNYPAARRLIVRLDSRWRLHGFGRRGGRLLRRACCWFLFRFGCFCGSDRSLLASRFFFAVSGGCRLRRFCYFDSFRMDGGRACAGGLVLIDPAAAGFIYSHRRRRLVRCRGRFVVGNGTRRAVLCGYGRSGDCCFFIAGIAAIAA